MHRILVQLDRAAWIDDERLNFGCLPLERDVDKVAAERLRRGELLKIQDTVNMTAQLQNESVKEQKEFNTSFERTLNTLTIRVDKVTKSAQHILDYHKGQNTAYELLMTMVLKLDLRKWANVVDLVEVPRPRLKIPGMGETFGQGVEWDGAIGVVLKDNTMILYLVEAKSALTISDITGMPARILRTKDFISLCQRGQLPLPNAGLAHKQLCKEWVAFSPAKVVGVIGGPWFSEEMLQKANAHDFVCIYPSGMAYTVDVVDKTMLMPGAISLEEVEDGLQEDDGVDVTDV